MSRGEVCLEFMVSSHDLVAIYLIGIELDAHPHHTVLHGAHEQSALFKVEYPTIVTNSIATTVADPALLHKGLAPTRGWLEHGELAR